MPDDLCPHMTNLVEYLKENNLRVWAEHSVDPFGWVNVSCGYCHKAEQTDALRADFLRDSSERTKP